MGGDRRQQGEGNGCDHPATAAHRRALPRLQPHLTLR
jgi:hypothetical protein